MSSNIDIALQIFREKLGAEHVIVDESSLAHASTATYATKQRVKAIIRPANASDIQACLKVANRG